MSQPIPVSYTHLDEYKRQVDTRAKHSQQGITGVPFIQLTGGGPQAARLEPGNDGEIPIIRTEPSALQNIADTANRLVARMDQLLSEETVSYTHLC